MAYIRKCLARGSEWKKEDLRELPSRPTLREMKSFLLLLASRGWLVIMDSLRGFVAGFRGLVSEVQVEVANFSSPL